MNAARREVEASEAALAAFARNDTSLTSAQMMEALSTKGRLVAELCGAAAKSRASLAAVTGVREEARRELAALQQAVAAMCRAAGIPEAAVRVDVASVAANLSLLEAYVERELGATRRAPGRAAPHHQVR